MALTETPPGDLGARCPEFRLPAAGGGQFGFQDLAPSAKATLVMFICNHCPYVIAVEDRLIALGRELKNQPVNIVAISANDAVKYPADSFPNMEKRAREKDYPFPYLFDESQSVARAFGAVCTPDFFLFDSEMKLRYRGRLDDSWKEPGQVKRRELKEAIDSLIAGRAIDFQPRPSMGCSIKWKT